MRQNIDKKKNEIDKMIMISFSFKVFMDNIYRAKNIIFIDLRWIELQ